ncbi:MAG TPA: HAMP domain-containing sensor histidine kinase, partial [Candidatus Cloacimonadota bacterium]|nr:HAMP domain-containing sensor histidine kinase [Candidatus Cloacimonadota bacterium]
QMKNYWNVSDNKTDQQIIDVNQTILKAKNIVLKHLDNDINININLSKDDLYISGNIILFEQILTNLLNNAIQALRQVNKPYKQIIVTTARCAGNYISIKVDDNAIGFLYENYPKEDDFLSTSKTSYDGMGLGLIIVKKFLDKFNGKIEFCNNELGGAGIELILPYK